MFKYLVLFSAFLIEAIATYVSVVGLSSLFAANLVIIILAMAFDLGKIVSVSFLYRHFKSINFIMRGYMLAATFVLMMITSAGAFGYLSGEFQKAISDTNQTQVIKQALEEEQARLQARKKEIDNQIAKLPDNSVRGRTALMKQFEPEVSKINERLIDIDAELPKLKIEAIKKGVEVGPIIYIAESFNTTPEVAVKWVILVMILVFDPLAITLLLAGNFLIAKEKEEKEQRLKNKDGVKDDDITVVSGAEEIADYHPRDEGVQEEEVAVQIEELKIEEPEVVDNQPPEVAVENPQPKWAPDYVVPKTPSMKSWSITLPEPEPIKVEQLPPEEPEPEVAVEEPAVQEVAVEEPKTEEPKTEELTLLKKEQVEPTTTQEEAANEPRQVIKLSDVNHVVQPHRSSLEDVPIHRSSLEGVDSRRADVESYEETTHIPPALKRIYSD